MGKENRKVKEVSQPKGNSNSVNKLSGVGNFTTFHKLSCFYTNADQLRNKLTELSVRTGMDKPQIVGITEVKTKNSKYTVKQSEYTLDNKASYSMFSANLDCERGRGLLLYIDARLEAVEVKLDTDFEECLFVKVQVNSRDKLLIGLVYRSPSGTNENNERLGELMRMLNKAEYSHILVMGDFNYPGIEWDTWNVKGDSTTSQEYRFMESVQDSYLFQHISKPTRWRGADSANVLDLVFTNEEHMISSIEYQSPIGKSDHCVLKFDFNCFTVLKHRNRERKLYNKANFEELNNDIMKTNWKELLDVEGDVCDINRCWSVFHGKIKELEDKHVPTSKPKVGKKDRKFPIDRKTQEMIKRKHALARKATRTGQQGDRQEYNRFRNKVKNHMNKLKKSFESDLAARAKSNPKAIWNYIKTKSKTRVGIGDLRTDPNDKKSRKTDDDSEKAEILASFFSSVFTREPDGELPDLWTGNRKRVWRTYIFQKRILRKCSKGSRSTSHLVWTKFTRGY